MKKLFFNFLVTCMLTSYSQDIKKAYNLDTSFVQSHINAFYIGCYDKKVGTIYTQTLKLN